MKKITLLIILFIITSCNNSRNEVYFNNNTNIKIDSVEVIGNPLCESILYRNIGPNKSFKEILKNCNKSNCDGSYILKIYIKNDTIVKPFGYFTNGYIYFKKIVIDYNTTGKIYIREFH